MDRNKMKLPKFFNVFGIKVKLKISDKLPINVAAQYEPSKEVITLNAIHDSDNELLHSILHECGHALFYRVSIQQAVSWETHEFIVNNFATMILENFEVKPKCPKK
jgi:Zn-dependent peptidase ImmA (M78 family)